ncbi:MAG: chromate transporter [Dehalococcoidales bacterium]|nr:chromate transporter [Dehalococcoidales bacterium]
MILIQLFLTFAKIGLFAFGGGYAALPLIEKELVNGLHWLTHRELLEVITISQLTPGPIGINAATFVGFKLNGVLGAIITTMGFCLPSVIIILVLVRFLKKFQTNILIDKIIQGLRPAVIALVASAAYSMVVKEGGITDITGIVIAVVSFLLIRSRKVDPILVLILAGISGIITYW